MSNNSKAVKVKAPTIAPKVVKRSISQVRRDIADWNYAKRMALLAENPKFYPLQSLYDDIASDALLTSQINNRHEKTIASAFEMYTPDGDVDEELTAQINDISIIQDVFRAILDSELYGYSLCEFSVKDGNKNIDIIDRRHIDIGNGRFYPDYYQNAYINYREAKEYGKWIIDFDSGGLGLLNKTVPHVLFKKFAQSCWSELCEIYGIPPRYIKTNTQDDAMLTRAENMLREMGAAAAFVIDTEEDFSFAQGISTNGDVYNNLIRLCNNENSLLISGAVIGQDTQHGNYSKEETAINILDRLIESDQRLVENYMNSVVIPAFISISWLPDTNSKFRFAQVENNEKLWDIVKELLPYKEVDNDFIQEKFGIPVQDKNFGLSGDGNLNFTDDDIDFFV